MPSNAERFLNAFNKVEAHLKRLSSSSTGRYVPFIELIRETGGSSPIIRMYKDDLYEYAELRNAIVHHHRNEIIAEPTEKVVHDIEKLLFSITKPKTAYDIASKPIFKCTYGDKIKEVVDKMVENTFTHVPVCNEQGVLVGVFSEASVTKWLHHSMDKDGCLLDQTKIHEVQKYFDQPKDDYNGYIIVSRNMEAYAVRELFLTFVADHRRLGVVFVTETGSAKEGILGVITAWDLPKIDDKV